MLELGILDMIIYGCIGALPGSYLIWEYFDGKEIEQEFGSFLYHVGLAGALIGFLLFWLGFFPLLTFLIPAWGIPEGILTLFI